MGNFDGYLICTDLDGTFAVGTEICGENAKYVKYFQENGGLFTVSTGRLPEHIKKFEDFKPNCPIITHNGAVIYDLDKEEALYQKSLPDAFVEITEDIKECESIQSVWLNGLRSFVNLSECEAIDLNEEYFKIVLVAKDADSGISLRNKLIEKYGEKYDIFMAWSVGVECLAKDTNKGTAVENLRKIMGNKVKKVICVGDSESDTFMLKCADIGYAVDNASEETKKAADRITVHYQEGAIAQIIKDIEKEL